MSVYLAYRVEDSDELAGDGDESDELARQRRAAWAPAVVIGEPASRRSRSALNSIGRWMPGCGA
jgi:hypothetical protein